MSESTVKLRITEKAQRMRLLMDRKDELEERLKEVNKELRKLKEVEIPKLLEDAEIEKISISGAGSLYVKDELYVTMTPGADEDNEKPFYGWARDNAPDLIVDYIHPARLKSWAKERLEQGQPIPSNTLKVTTVPTATLLRR